MSDSVPQKIEALYAQLDGLQTAADGLTTHPEAETSVRRIARSLEAAAIGAGLDEVAAGASAIQRAADAHLFRSVTYFLRRMDELRFAAGGEEITVLIVEDNRTVAEATKACLSDPGREFIVAENAQEATSIMSARHVDVVILDLILPDRDGRDLLVQMREQAATSIIPVIVLSSTESPVARAECLAVGADEFMVKPADPKSLRSAVTRQIQHGRMRRNAVRDGLTGLPNRAGIMAEFDQRRREAAVAKTQLCVAVISLDPLAEVSMKLGRDAGDRFLLEVCAALHDATGKGDRLGRWETAELVAVLSDRTVADCMSTLKDAIGTLLTDGTMDALTEAGIKVGFSVGATWVNEEQELRDAVAMVERSHFSLRSFQEQNEDDDDLGVLPDTARVLLVEDDRVTATLLHHRLIRDGYEVVDFLNGSEAFARAQEEAFDLAVLDVKVPGMDGFELLSKMRSIPHCQDIPIIMLTGMGSEADVIRGLELGANDYMLKPFSPTELLARVRRLLNDRGFRRDVHDGTGSLEAQA